MDSASSATNIITAAAAACAQIWQLSEIWHDHAPAELSHLRSELAEAGDFFGMVKLAVTDLALPRTVDWVGQLTYELEECCHKAGSSVTGVGMVLEKLLDEKYAHYGVAINDKRRRAVWVRNREEVSRLRGDLKGAMLSICVIFSMLDT